jgi:hypothetical protein
MSVVDCTNVSVEYVSSIFRTEVFTRSSPTLVPIDLSTQSHIREVSTLIFTQSAEVTSTPSAPSTHTHAHVSSVPETQHVDQLARTWHTTCCSTWPIKVEL